MARQWILFLTSCLVIFTQGLQMGTSMTISPGDSNELGPGPHRGAKALQGDQILVTSRQRPGGEIQEILTGLVKLLNGKSSPVPVSLPPPITRPTRTRINNRGPPRISEVVPPPYPFDRPPPIGPLPPQPPGAPTRPFGVPLPEQIIPVGPEDVEVSPVSQTHEEMDVSTPVLDLKPPDLNGNKDNGWPSADYPTSESAPVQSEKEVDVPEIEVGFVSVQEQLSENVNSSGNQTGLTGMELDENKSENSDFNGSTQPNNENNYENMPNSNSSSLQFENTEIAGSPNHDSIDPTSIEINSENTEEEIKTISISEMVSSTTSANANESGVLESNVSIADDQSVKASERDKSDKPATTNLMENSTVILETSQFSTVNEVPSGNSIVGVGVATPVLEGTVEETNVHDGVIEATTALPPGKATSPTTSVAIEPSKIVPGGMSYQPYRPRPGIVLDDTEYKPGGKRQPPAIITAPPQGNRGEIFDVTVSAIQGAAVEGAENSAAAIGTGKPFIYPVEIEGVAINGGIGNGHGGHRGEASVITAPIDGQEVVSIEGKRTYIDLMGTGVANINPTKSGSLGTAMATKPPTRPGGPLRPGSSLPSRRPGGHPRPLPAQPPVRIDTCIVGDPATCDSPLETCRTETGVSACHCRPGLGRRRHRDPCRRVHTLSLAIRMDRLYERRIQWSRTLADPSTEQYRQLQYESERAVASAMSMTPFSDEFVGVKAIRFYPTTSSVVMGNFTIQIEAPNIINSGNANNMNVLAARTTLAHDIQRHLTGVIHRRHNNVGDSAIWVDSPNGAVSPLEDLDECASSETNDCSSEAQCTNLLGSFSCRCREGTRDSWIGDLSRSGRQCEVCPAAQHCSNRGTCSFRVNDGQPICSCHSGYYGNQCEVDAEVLGVAVGASLAAIIIIGLTLVCLCMWSRRWNREQKSAAVAAHGFGGSPVLSYLAGPGVKAPSVGPPPYQVSLEDRMRWAQLAEVMAANTAYASTMSKQGIDNGTLAAATRPSSAMLGYPTLPPVPLPRLARPQVPPQPPPRMHMDANSSEEEDRADLLGSHFHMPRPKSRASVANQSGIYYDVEYEPADIYGVKHGQPPIPMSTYSVGRLPSYYH